MRVICVFKSFITENKVANLPLTLGKWYDVIDESFEYNVFGISNYTIIDDNGVKRKYICLNFVTEQKWRNGQIDKIISDEQI